MENISPSDIKKRSSAVILIQNWVRKQQVQSKFEEAQIEFREILKRIDGVEGKQKVKERTFSKIDL